MSKAKYYIIQGDYNLFAVRADEYRRRRWDYEPYCLGSVFVNRPVLEWGTQDEYESRRCREAVEKFNRLCLSRIEKQAKKLYGCEKEMEK